MRSKLFVPGSRVELFAKALNSEADAISLDLEDSIIESRKAEARDNVARFLCSPEVAASDKVFIVRVNGLNTVHFEADILAITQPLLHMVNLPKVESDEDIYTAVKLLEKAEKIGEMAQEISILANIESPKGLLSAAEIAASHPRVAGLQLGLNDLFASLSVDRQDEKNIHASMHAMRMAAGSAGIFAYDGAFADIIDKNAFQTEAEMAHRLGFLGKSCIHPDQLPLANEIFSHSDADIAFAARIIEESRRAETKGAGAFTLEGRMIDLPVIRRAQAVLNAGKSMKKLKNNDSIRSN